MKCTYSDSFLGRTILCLLTILPSSSFTLHHPSKNRPFANTHVHQSNFNESTYESDRLAKDALAMQSMKEQAQNEYAKLRTPWKWTIRKAVWDYLEMEDLAVFPRYVLFDFLQKHWHCTLLSMMQEFYNSVFDVLFYKSNSSPNNIRPVHHRIPNFLNANMAAQNLATLPEFTNAQLIKVNPDTPQRQVRHFVLENDKTLLTPQQRLRTGFFQTLKREDVPSDVALEALTTSKGAVSTLIRYLI